MAQLDQIYHNIDHDLDFVQSADEVSEIQKFYVDKSIFITGATGFMGKCLVEKLLRSCPRVKRLYLLMRESKKLSVEDRLNKYFEDKVFSKLKSLDPDFTKKITALKGDLNLERCGLSDKDIDHLKKNTNIIFHAAANVMFTANVKESLTVNVLATKFILD
ncbi:hypothetical protein QAD02_023815 [Eretmocerus hayati]|uniref:Uncharacterized protein n=1 Tax=Eretmocerus hayati TaxID=131215 RepID=A0ACC2Q1T4_9HYME|nr:hypothetical protein QAD02_023815 [Eretmocerus hayati]